MWLFLALLAVIFHNQLPGGRWLMVHLVMLGAVTHSITVWSNYFAVALLKPSPSVAESRARQSARLIMLNVGIALVVIGVPTAWWLLAAVGASLIVLELAWHAMVLLRMARKALPAPFAITVHYYLVAAAFFPVGITLGVLLARGLGDPAYERVLVAHTMINLLGWVGLSIIGTQLTLWPTVLRARIDAQAARRARIALWPFSIGIIVVAIGALLGSRMAAAAGLLIYLGALGLTWRSMLGALRRRPPRTFAVISLACGQVWLAAGLITLVASVVTRGWAGIGNNYTPITAIFVVGFALQTLLGAMTHLIPSVLGGGPKVYKAGARLLETGGIARATLLNGALLVALLPVPSTVRTLVCGLGALAMVAFVPLMFMGIRAAIAARVAIAKDGVTAPEPPVDDRARPVLLELLSALVALTLALSLGTALSPASTTAAATVRATGHTTTVSVMAHGMRFTPSTIAVRAGDRLVIEVMNHDPSQVHDLVLANGATTGRISPGKMARVDVGVISGDMDGWCSIIGHKQMGMTLKVIATGAPAGAAGTAATSGTAPSLDHDAMPAKGFQPWNAALPPAGGTVHRVTFTAQDSKHEIAPGVTQLRWTYNGGLASPVLHGTVGDTFVVTLKNDGTMGHSIDFHAGSLAPDQPMRTIEPGQTLVYTFKATRAGIWMYHCSTTPMSTHIASGMAGAVIIDPPGLPAVDTGYVLVQSEIYAGTDSQIDTAMVDSKSPNFVVFNGYADQYDHAPLTAKVGQRVRIWLLDAGPNLPTAFHVVGGQFDTVYKEGAYLLKNGVDAFGDKSGGSQTLDLAPSQGGFVELTFPEAGHYPFVSHVMTDAEKGAHGIFGVVP